MGENWTESNFYCPSCLETRVSRQKASTKVIDFRCPRCNQTYNVKASKTPFGRRVRDAEYATFMQAIRERKNPNLVLLHYDKPRLLVVDLEVIPRFFFSSSCVIPSKPTLPKSRSKPWQGCDVSLERVPVDGHIEMVEEGRIVDPEKVNQKYHRAEKLLLRRTINGRGWTADVLRCVRDLRKSPFTLHEVYAYENELQRLHPENRFVIAKIRQQLQILRDHGILRFAGDGRYELL